MQIGKSECLMLSSCLSLHLIDPFFFRLGSWATSTFAVLDGDDDDDDDNEDDDEGDNDEDNDDDAWSYGAIDLNGSVFSWCYWLRL